MDLSGSLICTGILFMFLDYSKNSILLGIRLKISFDSEKLHCQYVSVISPYFIVRIWY
jgi:hypothetical protein